MSIQSYPRRVQTVAIAASLLLAVLCGTVAITLVRELSRTATALGEDIDSRGAATNLEASLNALAALHEHRTANVEPLLDQIRSDLAEIHRLADKPEEIALVQRVTGDFNDYLRKRELREPDAVLAQLLRERAVPAATSLREYNGRELGRSQESHRRALTQIIWGLAVVGALGSVAGLVLGYGLARGLRRTIHQFLVRVQGASDRLGQEVPTVEWQRYGEPMQDGGDELIRRVEQVVQKLQQRGVEVRRAERFAAVGQLAAGMAHEIRNPLTSAILLLETSRRDPSAGPLTDYDLNLIEAELQRIERSLQSFLDYARPPKIERTVMDAGSVIADALALVRGRCEQQRVRVTFRQPSPPVTLSADREQVRQVVLNLVLNALDAMPKGGEITVTLGRDPSRHIVEFSVSDTGAGISPEILPRLFEPFASGKQTGLGLGLVVARRIVEEHGGTIQGVNQPQAGARFTVQLPIDGPDAADQSPGS